MTTSKNFFITQSGNILVQDNNTYYFTTADGVFLRVVGEGEFESLHKKLKEIFFKGDFSLPEVPVWKFLYSVKKSDYSQYEEQNSRNGGSYAFHVEYMFYARVVRGIIQYCCLPKHSTSAEFEYAEDGSGFGDTWSMKVIGTEKDFHFTTNSQPFFGREEVALDQLVEQNISFMSVLNAESDDETLSVQQKLERAKLIKRLTGISPVEQEKRVRKSKRRRNW